MRAEARRRISCSVFSACGTLRFNGWSGFGFDAQTDGEKARLPRERFALVSMAEAGVEDRSERHASRGRQAYRHAMTAKYCVDNPEILAMWPAGNRSPTACLGCHRPRELTQRRQDLGASTRSREPHNSIHVQTTHCQRTAAFRRRSTPPRPGPWGGRLATQGRTRPGPLRLSGQRHRGRRAETIGQ
jgi:hypothetical protein